MRLPASVRLPFGYTVRVRLVTDGDMRVLGEVKSDEEMLDGLWVDANRTIYIRKALPMKRQRYILWHELTHAVTDGMHQSLNMETAKP